MGRHHDKLCLGNPFKDPATCSCTKGCNRCVPEDVLLGVGEATSGSATDVFLGDDNNIPPRTPATHSPIDSPCPAPPSGPQLDPCFDVPPKTPDIVVVVEDDDDTPTE